MLKTIQLRLRCLAWPEGGQWVAICLELALAAQGRTRQEAQQRLHAQIVDYVREAVTVDVEHCEQLLARSAPLRDRLRFYFWLAMNSRPRLRRAGGKLLERLGVGIRNKRPYCDALPLVPA